MLATMTENEILAQIADRERMSKLYGPKHPLGEKANRILMELYAEMSKRTKQ